MAAKFITGLDIGTFSIKAAVAEGRDGLPYLKGIFKEPSSGIRKGIIVDIVEISSSISKILNDIKKSFGKQALKDIYLNIGTTKIRSQISHGIVAVSRADNEIYQDDVERVVKASQAVAISPNRTVVHNVTREFIVDGINDIMDPIGLSGNRLELYSVIIDAFTPHINSLTRAVELAGYNISGMFINPLVGTSAVLSKQQKDLGVALIDIGYGTTGLSVYEEGKLVGVANFPVGAGNITNDLAIGLKIPVEAAENIKLRVGYAVSKEINPKESIELKKFSDDNKGSVSRRFISEIIESRLAEIFEFVNNELKLMGKAGQLAGGSVLIGGGAKMPGITNLAKKELKLSSQIGSGLVNEWSGKDSKIGDVLEDPEMVNVLGLVLWGSQRKNWKPSKSNDKMSIFKKIANYFVP